MPVYLLYQLLSVNTGLDQAGQRLSIIIDLTIQPVQV